VREGGVTVATFWYIGVRVTVVTGRRPNRKKKQLMPLGPKFQKNSKPSSVDLVLGDRAKINFADFRDSALLK